MWYFKWLLILVYVIHSVSTVYSNNRKFISQRTISRHKHHQELMQQRSVSHMQPLTEYELRATNNKNSNKLRHHGTNGNNNNNHNAHNSFSKLDKFPKLKEIGKRLDSIQRASPSYTPMYSSKTKNHHWKYGYEEDDRNKDALTDTIEDFKDDYEEDEDDADDDYVDETARATSSEITNIPGDADEEDEEVEDGDYEDEIVEEDRLRPHDIQAEESVREQSPMTKFKWENYGTRAKVEESRLKQESGHRAKDNEQVQVHLSLAVKHISRISLHGRCRVPRPKVINVQHEHPSAGKAFRPHCTILHRCADDTGCCQEPGTKCLPKKQELIHLYFYSTTYSPVQTRTEELAFYNHTECGCLEEDAVPELTSPSSRLIRSKYGHYGGHNHLSHENTISCKCPEEYIPKMIPRFAIRSGSGKCVCDCSPNSESLSGCMNMKRGKEHFSLKDRLCIVEEKCGQPTCEYGTYMKGKGRCPRKQEKMDWYAKANVSRNGAGANDDDEDDDDSFASND